MATTRVIMVACVVLFFLILCREAVRVEGRPLKSELCKECSTNNDNSVNVPEWNHVWQMVKRKQVRSTMLKISGPQNQVTVRELVTPSTIEHPALVLIQPSMPQLLGVEVLMVGRRRSY
uniref:Uncharacterized protein n=1 Tax=Salix viminalis TaxID=40686 RepID=A0A6N2M466_SALVM